MVPPVTSREWEKKVLQSPIPVMVDVWARWCAPCRMIAPTIDQASDRYAGQLRVLKLDADNNQDILEKYGVRGIPTLLMFRDGELVSRHTGALPEAGIFSLIDELLAPPGEHKRRALDLTSLSLTTWLSIGLVLVLVIIGILQALS